MGVRGDIQREYIDDMDKLITWLKNAIILLDSLDVEDIARELGMTEEEIKEIKEL